MRRYLALFAAAAAVVLLAALRPAAACVGRTINIGYYEAPDQSFVASLLSVFIDERTGTTAKLVRFSSRREALEALRDDRVSLFVDHAGAVLESLGEGRPDRDPQATVGRLKEVLNMKYKVVWIAPMGYDRRFSGKGGAAGGPVLGQAGVMLCKEALSRFPALPKLLGKLSGLLDNRTMESLLLEAQVGDPRAVARRFLKSRRLI